MTRASSRLAKLTRPDTAGLLFRERLFALLERTLSGHFAWISGAAGAGKTSLVSSWIDQRAHNVVWYRIDAADTDPATFFHYHGLAAAAHSRGRRRPLPHLTPEYPAGLRDFTRRYFREFFARLRPPCVVVFDNCHEATTDSPLEDIIAWAVDEAPDQIAIVGVSRADPGEPFARRMSDARFAQITTEDLRLTEAEAQAVAENSGEGGSAVPALLAQVDGWAAGFILLLRAHARELATRDAASAHGAIFDYFTGEILAVAGGRLREFLLRTAVLPVVSPSLAEQLTGFEEASALLAELHRKHFFTERRLQSSEEALYEYHPLFREFLLTRARQEMGVEAFSAHCRNAAVLLDQSGRAKTAVALRIIAADWPALVAAICTQAPLMMSQGRWQTLVGWIAALVIAARQSCRRQ